MLRSFEIVLKIIPPKEKYIILNWVTELNDLVTNCFREVTKGYKNNEVIWLFVSLRLCQVQAFP